MARCVKCKKYMLLPSQTGYCDDCIALVGNAKFIKKGSQELLNLSDEEWRSIFAKKAKELLEDAQQRFDQHSFDDELLELLQHALIFADDETDEWHQASELYKITKKTINDIYERKCRDEEEHKIKERERKESNMKNNLHVGLIEHNGFWDRKRNLRDYTFIRLIDGYNSIMYWDEDWNTNRYIHEGGYDNENWTNERPAGKVFFHIQDQGEGSIKDAIDQIRHGDQRYRLDGICVAFSVVSSKKGWKAIDVISIEDALSQKNTLEYFKEKVSKDINVYFFLMNHKPELFEKFFSKITIDKVWKFTVNNEDVELTGTNIQPRKKDKSRWDADRYGPDNYYFPSETVFLPYSIAGKPVSRISSSAFAHIGIVKKFIIPDTVFDIGEGAFEDCIALEEVIMSKNTKKICARAFANCVNLKKIVLPDQLIEVGEMAFSGTGLTEVTIPASVKYIDDSAFSNCNVIIKRRLR